MIADVIRFLIDLADAALRGDAQAQEKLRDILPERMFTDMVAEAQDKLDREKFGRRDDTPTSPGRRRD